MSSPKREHYGDRWEQMHGTLAHPLTIIDATCVLGS